MGLFRNEPWSFLNKIKYLHSSLDIPSLSAKEKSFSFPGSGLFTGWGEDRRGRFSRKVRESSYTYNTWQSRSLPRSLFLHGYCFTCAMYKAKCYKGRRQGPNSIRKQNRIWRTSLTRSGNSLNLAKPPHRIFFVRAPRNPPSAFS